MSCLTDFDSILVASPFNKMCLNYAEIIMMTLVALSVLVAMIVLISNLVLFQRLNNYRKNIIDFKGSPFWISFLKDVYGY